MSVWIMIKILALWPMLVLITLHEVYTWSL